MADHLIPPHGGSLTNLMLDDQASEALKIASKEWPSWTLGPRQLCDLELILDGSFSPLAGFMNKKDFDAVCTDMRLADGTLWPLPVSLDVTTEMAQQLRPGTRLALRDAEGVMLAVLEVEETWPLDREAQARAIYGTLDATHPGVAHILHETHDIAVGGRLAGLQLPHHYDFVRLRRTPAELRKNLARLGWRRVVAFQTRSPLHRAQVELTQRAARKLETNLLIQAVVGMARPGDIDHYTRVRCCQAVLRRYPQQTSMFSLLPLATRMGGPREALLHAIICKNQGCTHVVVGSDHAGAGVAANGEPFYQPYEAQELFRRHQDELGIQMVPFKRMVYVEDRDAYLPEDEVPEGSRVLHLSPTELNVRLARGREIPAWFTYPEVARELRRSHPPCEKQGVTVFFTGLSGSGKSTIANVLMVKFLEMGGRPVTLLDGDIVRQHLSSELGFSKAHRDINIRRIGFVASEIAKNGGIAICAPIAPYDQTRKEVRRQHRRGGFILVHVATPLEVCEQRDRKGLYAKARAGQIKEFTGISDPYEVPQDAEVSIDTTHVSPEEAAQTIILHLEREGYIGPTSQVG